MYEEAEKMHRESLEVESQLNSLGGMARQYFNLGRVHEQMGDLEKARNMMFKSKKLYGEAGEEATAHYVEKQIHQLKKT
jgi:tetratricopeptide (TPR) repeat protein